MSKTTLPEEQKRLSVYEEMTPSLQKVADSFQLGDGKVVRGLVLIRYDMGAKIREVIDKEAEYGANAVKQLAAYLNKSETELYSYRSLAETYERAEVEELAQRTMGKGGHISISHLLALSQVKKAADRKRLTERMFAESLSASTLMTEISAGVEKTNKRSGGRKPARPTSAISGVQTLLSKATNLNNAWDVFKDTTFDEIDKMGPDNFTPVLVDKLEQTVAALTTLETEATQARGRAEKNLKRAKTIVDKRVKEQEAEARAEEKKLAGKRKAG